MKKVCLVYFSEHVNAFGGEKKRERENPCMLYECIACKYSEQLNQKTWSRIFVFYDCKLFDLKRISLILNNLIPTIF